MAARSGNDAILVPDLEGKGSRIFEAFDEGIVTEVIAFFNEVSGSHNDVSHLATSSTEYECSALVANLPTSLLRQVSNDFGGSGGVITVDGFEKGFVPNSITVRHCKKKRWRASFVIYLPGRLITVRLIASAPCDIFFWLFLIVTWRRDVKKKFSMLPKMKQWLVA